jgi:L-ascorbate metabolism protein UlaG (beta-lactamase superfamily)
MTPNEAKVAYERIKKIEKDVEHAVSHPVRSIVRIEKKLVDFPFRKYFIGHRKPERAKYKPDWHTWPNDRLTLAWLGHSTVLINFYGTWILTDPVFTERCGVRVGPWTVGPRRLVHPPLKISELPPIDILLISHAHMDHTDIPSLRALQKMYGGAKHVIIASNTRDVYVGLKLNDVHEVDWNESVEFASSKEKTAVKVTGLEVRHAGWRMPWDACRSRNEKKGRSYNAYLVEKEDDLGHVHSFVFGGDTGYTPHFKALGDKLRAEGREIECALMPIGTYNPWVEAHCNPEQAWRMTQEMNARVIVPIHWNTFTQSSEPRYEPMQWLRSIAEPHRIALTEHGQTWQAAGD